MQGQSGPFNPMRICMIVVLCAACFEAAVWIAGAPDECAEGAAQCDQPTAVSRLERDADPDASVPTVGALRGPADSAKLVTSSKPVALDALGREIDDRPEAEILDPLLVDALDPLGIDPMTLDDEAFLPGDEEIDLLGLLAEMDEEAEGAVPAASAQPAEASVSTPEESSDTSPSVNSAPSPKAKTKTVVSWLPAQTVETWLWPWPGVENHGVTLARVSCDAHDAVRISQASQLYLLGDSSYRVFCIAPGDYRGDAPVVLTDISGTPTQPRIVQVDSDALDRSLGIAEADDSDLPTLPPVQLVDSDDWQFIGVRWQESTESPLILQNADRVMIDRVRVGVGSTGMLVEESDEFRFQRSLVTASELDESQCLSLALEAGASAAVSNSEFNGCHRALEVSAESGVTVGDVQIAGNEFHRESESGAACDAVGLWLDADATTDSMLQVVDNQFSGWQPNSDCAPGSGAGVTVAERSDGVLLERNVLWGASNGLVIQDDAGVVTVQDTVIVGDGAGHAVRVGSGSSRVSLSANHFIEVDRWLDSERNALTVSCNTVGQSGLPAAPVSTNTVIIGSSYVGALPGVMAASDGSDQVVTQTATAMGELCMSSHALSDPSTQCLDAAARDPAEVSCGSDYWVTQ